MFDSSKYTTTQKFATSKDGTQIPFFLTHRKNIKLDGSNPTLLYGYGGFEISCTPHYVPVVGTAWLDRGGVYIEANIRGGGEYGPQWHQAAKRENRNKSFEDFIAVGEDVIAKGICTPERLGVRGGSNGGLLMGMMMVLRPDLFGAISCLVPLLDMGRYNLLLAGASWVGEYGDPSVDEDWEFLQNYSPFHLLKPGVKYPKTLFTSSTLDDRVHPAHARKCMAKIESFGGGSDSNVFYYENVEGGHGSADNKQAAFMSSLEYDFLMETLSQKMR